MENYDAVLDYFKKSQKPASASQIAIGTGLERKEVDKIMTRLKKEEKIISPKVCYWQLKDNMK